MTDTSRVSDGDLRRSAASSSRLLRRASSPTDDQARTAASFPDRLYPFSGTCERCGRERDDLFYHRFDHAYYCADVFRCEARFEILANRWMREEATRANA